MAASSRTKRDVKGKRSKEDTWKADELAREIGKGNESDKKRIGNGGKERDKLTKEKSPFKDTSRSQIKDKDRKPGKSDERIKDKGKQPGRGVESTDKRKERIVKVKESQSPRNSPKLKDRGPPLGSPLHAKKGKINRGLDTPPGSKTSSPLTKRSKQPNHSSQKETAPSRKPQTNERSKPSSSRDQQPSTNTQEPSTNTQEHVNMETTVVPMEEVIDDISLQDDLGRGADTIEDDDNDYQYSDDQFEEYYEEDFEEDSNTDNDHDATPPLLGPEIDDIMQAIDTENQDMERRLATPDASGVEPSAPSLHSLFSPRPKMSFTSPSVSASNSSHGAVIAVQYSRTALKMRTRANELSKLITMDVMGINLFEMNPQSEYDFYMRSFGTSNTHQTGTQTGCDHEEIETQTDEITTKDRWTQHPPQDLKGYGEGDDADSMDDDYIVTYNTESFIKFIERAGKVVLDLLEEGDHSDDVNRQKSQYTTDPYCTLKATLDHQGSGAEGASPPGTIATCIDWRQANPNLYLIGYGDNPSIEGGGAGGGILKLWNIVKPSSPLFVLGNPSTPAACCLIFPLVISGNSDGSIVVWDLREPLSMHRTQHTGKLHRVPTFTTAALGWDSGHYEPILCLNTTSSGLSNEIDWQQEHTAKGLSSQILSVDSSGKVCVWVVVEVLDPDFAGSDTDLGLVPGGKIKLIANSSFRIFNPSLLSPSICCVHIKDINTNALLIGTDNGDVLCHVRYKASPSTKTYSLKSIQVNQSVSSISLHPTSVHHFLVGYSTGHVALYHTSRPHPLILWSPPLDSSIHSLHWHPLLPSVFTGVWGDTTVYIWDLLQNDATPLHKLSLENKIVSALPVCSFDNQPSLVITSGTTVDVYQLNGLKLTHSQETLNDYFTILF